MIRSLSMAILLGGMGWVATLQATDWLLAPGITLQQVFTDNANLDAEERFESISRISPRISAYREGVRAKLDLRYAPQYRHYWQETRSNQVVHFLRADGDIELYEDHLFVDGWATADQHTINSGGRTGIDSLTGSGELTEVYTGGISPYFTSRLGPYVSLEARYGIDRVYYEEVGLNSSTGQRADLVFGSAPIIRQMPWELHLQERHIKYDDLEDDDRIRQVRGELIYQLNRRWSLAGVLGYEDYQLAVNEDFDGQIWGVGFIFTPSSRTRLALGGGERAFGENYYLDFSHRAKRSVWRANYERDVVSARDEVQRPGLFAREDAFGKLVRDPVLSSPVSTPRSGASLTEEYYLLGRFTADMTLATERTALSLSAAHIDREYETASLTPDSTDIILTMQLSRTLRARTTGFIRLRWNDYEADINDYVQWIATLGGGYQLGEHTSLNLSLAHLDRNANLDTNSYQENRVSLGLQASW